MHNFPLSQIFDRFTDIIILYYTKDVFVGASGLLLWGDLVSTTYTKI